MLLPTNHGRCAILQRIRVECQHCGHSTSLFETEDPGKSVRKDLFRYLAEIKTTNRDEAYALTQNGNPDLDNQTQTWAKDNRAYLTDEGKRLRDSVASQSLRSTSVGDIIVEPDGRAWMCEAMGWLRLVDQGSEYLICEE